MTVGDFLIYLKGKRSRMIYCLSDCRRLLKSKVAKLVLTNSLLVCVRWDTFNFFSYTTIICIVIDRSMVDSNMQSVGCFVCDD